jgi:K+-sensing histidine kinase KdpD
MEIKNAKRWAKAGPEPYLAALFGYCVAFALRFALMPLVGDHLPMLFFAINSMVISFLYGARPALFILALSLPTSSFFFVQPYYSFGPISHDDVFAFIVYTSLVVLTAFLMEWVRREQYRAELHARVSDSRYRLLVEADEDRRTMRRRESATPGAQ